MEVLAYLHHSLAHETPDDYQLVMTWDGLQFIQEFPLKQLSSQAAIPLVIFACGVAIAMTAESAAARTLSRGNAGEDVLQLQQALSSVGYFHGPFTGYYGSLTQQAVATFQRSNGLSVDGIAGPSTKSALWGGVDIPQGGTGGSTLRYGSTGASVRQLQYDLADAGYYSPSGPFTDYYGSLTEAAVMSLQRAYGLSQDGIVGPQTRAVLATALGTGVNTPATATGSTSYLKFGSTGSAVTQLQYDLASAGVYDPAGPFTEYFGELTESAVYRLQAYYGLTQDGVVGPSTRSVIGEAIALGGIPPYGSGAIAATPEPEDSSSSNGAENPPITDNNGTDGSTDIASPTPSPEPTDVASPTPSPEPTDIASPTPSPEPTDVASPTPSPEPTDAASGGDPGTSEDEEALPMGFIQLQADLQTYSTPNGEPLDYPLTNGEILGYLEDRGDGWIRIGFPGAEGSWIYAGANYGDVKFLNGASSATSASPTPEETPIATETPTETPTTAASPQPNSTIPPVSTLTANIFVGPSSIEIQNPVEVYDAPKGTRLGETLQPGDVVSYGSATAECWVSFQTNGSTGWVFAGAGFEALKFKTDRQNITVQPPSCTPAE